jgi:tetratricopeptide (TPR) repeat protein
VSTVAETVAARLASGEDLGIIAFAMLPPRTREAVKRLAAVPAFDAAIYQSVLRPADGPELEELLESGQVQHLPGTPARYRVEPNLRDGGWSSWWTDEGMSPGSPTVPPSLARHAERLADYYCEAGQPLEELRSLLIVDANRARDLFLRQYAVANEEFDLARCQDVIDVLASGDRAQLVPVELARLRNERQTFLSARSMWAAEFHQTARYLPRPKYEAALRRLLKGMRSRVLQIVAPGGMGKTMQLRWFVARHCLVQQPPVPCARIDFDIIDPVNAVRYPWLLLLELAAQLDQQIPGAPFRELIRDFERYIPLLSRASEPAEASVDEGTAIDANAITYRFCAALAEARAPDEPVVLLFDTMEEVVQRPGGSTAALVGMLRRIRDEARSARLVLSGRYDLAKHLGGFRAGFGTARAARMEEFSAAEARRYLTSIRGITRAGLVDAIVRKCDGLPFTLALFGDIAAQDPTLTRSEVEFSTRPALLYCIVRILERIDDDRLRWLLRYGVVPRQLTYRFLLDVIWPHLVRGIAGGGPDEPARDARPPRPKQIFRQAEYPAPAERHDILALWEQLKRYAGESSWVSAAGDTLTFHVRIRTPLRDLLRAQPVFEILHRDAIAYFERLADDRPGQWSRWTREALYHRFQLDQSVAVQAWRDAISHARAAARPDWVEDLAADLFSPDYADDPGEPDRTVVGDRARYEARVEIARVYAEAARADHAGVTSPTWSTAQRHLQEADRLLAESTKITVPSARHLILHASVELAREDRDAAVRYLGSLSGGDMGADDLRDALLIQAESAVLGGDPAAGEQFDAAFKASVVLRDVTGAAQIAADAAVRCLVDDRQFEALRWCQRGEEMKPVPQIADRLASIAQTAILELGFPAEAVRRAFPDGSPEFVPHQSGESAAEALLAMDRPAAALRVLLPNETPKFPGGHGAWRRALLCGRAHGMLLRVEAATDVLEWGLRASPGDVQRAILANELATISLRYTGDVRQAAYHVDNADRYRVAPGSDAWLDLRLTQIELAASQEGPESVSGLVNAVLEPFRGRGTTRRRAARLAVRCLAATTGPAQDQLLRILLNALDSPQLLPATRLSMLRDLRYCPAIGNAGEADREEFGRLVLQPWEDERESESVEQASRAWLDLVAVEAYRLLGRLDEAQAMLDRAVPVLANDDPYIWWQWVKASDRIGPARVDEPEPPSALLERYRADSALSGAYLVDLAARRLLIDPPSLSLRRLDDAERMLAQADRRLAWRLRPQVLRERLTSSGYLAPPAQAARSSGAADLHPAPVRAAELAARIGDTPWPDPLTDLDLVEELRHSRATWASRCGDILAGLVGPGLARATPDAPIDVRLDFLSSAQAAIPWEMAHIGDQVLAYHRGVRFVYRGAALDDARTVEILLLRRSLHRLGALGDSPVDDTVGPATAVGLHDFQRNAGLPETDWPDPQTWQALREALRRAPPARPPHVLLLQQDVGRSIRSHRGPQGSMADAEAIYKSYRVRTSVLWNPTKSAASDYLERLSDLKDRPDVLHICASVETSDRRLVLDFSGGFDPSEALPATAIGDLAQAVGPAMPPLVVVDALAPPTSGELVRQLLLRNAFCQQLADLLGGGVVLGTGLTADRARMDQLRRLAQSLADHENPAETWRRLTAGVAGEDTLETGPRSLGPLLCSSLPPDALPEPGLW